jgi:hypothetical protein
MDTKSRKRQCNDLSFLSDVWLYPVTCGSTLFWENEGFPGTVNVAIGNFADPNFPPPTIAVWEQSRHPWVSLSSDTPPKRAMKQE